MNQPHLTATPRPLGKTGRRTVTFNGNIIPTSCFPQICCRKDGNKCTRDQGIHCLCSLHKHKQMLKFTLDPHSRRSKNGVETCLSAEAARAVRGSEAEERMMNISNICPVSAASCWRRLDVEVKFPDVRVTSTSDDRERQWGRSSRLSSYRHRENWRSYVMWHCSGEIQFLRFQELSCWPWEKRRERGRKERR